MMMPLMTTYRYGGLSQESITDQITGMSYTAKFNINGMHNFITIATDKTPAEVNRILRESDDVEEPIFNFTF